jgi:uncharacterized protein (TIGR03435 family)
MNPSLVLLEASLLRPLALVLTAWLMLRVLKVRHPASRHTVWTAVLIGMLVLPLISVVAPHWTLPVLPWSNERTASPLVATDPVTATSNAELPAPAAAPTNRQLASESPKAFIVPSPQTSILWLYIAGLVIMAGYRLIGWALLQGVLARSNSLGCARLRESDDVVTPVTVGVLRPIVLLPAGWREWNRPTKRAVFAHEFAHLRRGDTLVAALARLVKCVFWFHPIAWWVSRQTSDLAELACDAIALERVGDPAGYSRVLVEFAGAVSRSGQRIALPGLAIASRSRMSERVDQVFEMSNAPMRRLPNPHVWLPLLGVPVVCFAATVVLGARPDQDAVVKTQMFDVVSIKPCAGIEQPSRGGGRSAAPWNAQVTPGFVYWDCVSLRELVDQAYAGGGNLVFAGAGNQLRNVPQVAQVDPLHLGENNRVRGGPAWAGTDRFTIEAKFSNTRERTREETLALMRELPIPMRALLEDRFQLKVRRATEEKPMYALTVAAGGLKLTPAPPDSCWTRVPGMARGTTPPGYENKPPCGGANARRSGGDLVVIHTGVTLEGFANYLARVMDRYVIDKTGVTGMFNTTLEYSPNENTVDTRAPRLPGAPQLPPATAPNIFKALEALGLKLEPTKGPAEYLVIDSAQRPRPDSPAEAANTPARARSAGRQP